MILLFLMSDLAFMLDPTKKKPYIKWYTSLCGSTLCPASSEDTSKRSPPLPHQIDVSDSTPRVPSRRLGRGFCPGLVGVSGVAHAPWRLLHSTTRSRPFLLFLALLVFFSFFLLTATGPRRARFHSLVEETNQVRNVYFCPFHSIVSNYLYYTVRTYCQIVDNLKQNFEDEDEEDKDPLSDVDEKYLEELGLLQSSDPFLWPDSPWRRAGNASEPVVLSAVHGGRVGEAVHFLRNSQLLQPELKVLLYDLGLSAHETKLLETYCNDSTSCILRKFDGSVYPGHVRNAKTGAFRPVLIQSTLRDAGCVLWMDLEQRFADEAGAGAAALAPYLERARSNGVLTWAMDDNVPTSSRTHPKMFSKLGVRSDGAELENYNFQHMVDLRALLVYNTGEVRDRLMSPWVRCALSEDCLEPLGAQSSGCRFDKKPQYRYSGCHGYEVSALNVVLGQMFNFEETK